jgi:hypothetical protein
MPLINPTAQPAYYVIQSENIDGVTPMAQATGVNNALTTITAEGEAAFLDATKAIGSYKPLPATGTPLQTGEIYGYNNGLVIVRQSHNRTADAPPDVPALFSVYRSGQGILAWTANEAVVIGTQRTYSGQTYRCLQAHTTQVDWTPPAVPALWQVTVPPSPNWAYPVAYKVNDIVIYVPNGFTYKCRQAHTSQVDWTPPAVASLWLKQ